MSITKEISYSLTQTEIEAIHTIQSLLDNLERHNFDRYLNLDLDETWDVLEQISCNDENLFEISESGVGISNGGN